MLRRSNVVYKITCNCGDSYIGQTKRNLEFRIKEHKSGPSRNDRDVSKHLIKNPEHRIDFNNVNILAHSDNWSKLLIQETLLYNTKSKTIAKH